MNCLVHCVQQINKHIFRFPFVLYNSQDSNISDATISAWNVGSNTDSSPPFEGTATIAEDATTIITVTATTVTMGGTIDSYTIQSQPEVGQFEIDTTNGVITLGASKSIDREMYASRVLVVE